MTDAYKLHVKLGDAVFEAEGPKETVEAQFQLFLKAAQHAPSPAPKPQNTGLRSGSTHTIPDEEASQLFEDRDDLFSLHTLPTSEYQDRDTLILLLWGYRTFKQQSAVAAGELMRAARQSGLTLMRIDRILNAATNFVRSGGVKKGKRYSLNNQGINHAVQLMQSMLEG